MLTGIGYIASKTRAKMRTLQAAAPIPAFMAGSMLRLRRNGSVVILSFRGHLASPFGLVEHRDLSRDKGRSTEHEGIVGKLRGRQSLCVHHGKRDLLLSAHITPAKSI
jgi:hypothetical protein